MASGGSAVFVDQPVQYGFSADSLDIEVDCCDAGSFALIAGNPLGDALMRPGSVVVDLVLDQDGAQVRGSLGNYGLADTARLARGKPARPGRPPARPAATAAPTAR